MESYAPYPCPASDIFSNPPQPKTALAYALPKIAGTRLRPMTPAFERFVETEAFETARRCQMRAEIEAVADQLTEALAARFPAVDPDYFGHLVTDGTNRASQLRWQALTPGQRAVESWQWVMHQDREIERRSRKAVAHTGEIHPRDIADMDAAVQLLATLVAYPGIRRVLAELLKEGGDA